MLICFRHDIQCILAFSYEEGASYIEQFLKFQGSGTSILTGYDKHKTHTEKCIDILSSIPTITKNDAKKLLTKYGSIAEVISADIDEF